MGLRLRVTGQPHDYFRWVIENGFKYLGILWRGLPAACFKQKAAVSYSRVLWAINMSLTWIVLTSFSFNSIHRIIWSNFKVSIKLVKVYCLHVHTVHCWLINVTLRVAKKKQLHYLKLAKSGFSQYLVATNNSLNCSLLYLENIWTCLGVASIFHSVLFVDGKYSGNWRKYSLFSWLP